MAKIFVIGKITGKIEMKYSENGVPYVRFDFMEISMETDFKPQFYQIWAWYKNAEDLIKFNVDKDNTIQITGTLKLECYVKNNGVSADKRLKVLMDSWSFISKNPKTKNKKTV